MTNNTKINLFDNFFPKQWWLFFFLGFELCK